MVSLRNYLDYRYLSDSYFCETFRSVFWDAKGLSTGVCG
jgi:hypothetical protein